jgi:hypothetical protein
VPRYFARRIKETKARDFVKTWKPKRRTEFLRTDELSILGGVAGGEAIGESCSFEFEPDVVCFISLSL